MPRALPFGFRFHIPVIGTLRLIWVDIEGPFDLGFVYCLAGCQPFVSNRFRLCPVWFNPSPLKAIVRVTTTYLFPMHLRTKIQLFALWRTR